MSKPASWEAQYPTKPSYDTAKVKAMQNQVDEVVGIMRTNVEKVVERDQKLDDLNLRADKLNEVAADFKTTSRKVKGKMWWRNMKMILILASVVIILVVIVIVVTGLDDDIAAIVQKPELPQRHSSIAPKPPKPIDSLPKSRLIRSIFQD